MSYTRKYSAVVHHTVNLSYPKSDSGGNISKDVDVPIDVIIEVDTTPFDGSVSNCGTTVDYLTAAVVATETAEIASKRKNSKKVADTIVGGFFSYIRSEISQQIAELSQSIDAHIMHLKELSLACSSKMKQMEGDYNRISDRYTRVFDDLNHELSNRIYELDRPSFVFKRESDKQSNRSSNNDLVNIIAVFGNENVDLHSKISSSIAKKRTFDTISKAKIFLWQQKKLNLTIQQCTLNESLAGRLFAPVCFVEVFDVGGCVGNDIFIPNYLSMLADAKQRDGIVRQFNSKSIHWKDISADDHKGISLYFIAELNSGLVLNNRHSARVKEMIQRIADISFIKTIN